MILLLNSIVYNTANYIISEDTWVGHVVTSIWLGWMYWWLSSLTLIGFPILIVPDGGYSEMHRTDDAMAKRRTNVKQWSIKHYAEN